MRGQAHPCGTRLAPPDHSQLILVRANGMQVEADECGFIRSYLWFVDLAGRNYLWSKNPLDVGRSVFKCRSLQLRTVTLMVLLLNFGSQHPSMCISTA